MPCGTVAHKEKILRMRIAAIGRFFHPGKPPQGVRRRQDWMKSMDKAHRYLAAQLLRIVTHKTAIKA
jgi:hypothetical protein